MSKSYMDEYREIEQAVMETERGRQFLAEHSKRARNNDTAVLLGAIARLEQQFTNQSQLQIPLASADDSNSPAQLLQTIIETKKEIDLIRNDMIDKARSHGETEDVFASTAAQAKLLAEEIMEAAAQLQAEQKDSDDEACQRGAFAEVITQWGYVLDVTAQRMVKTAELVNHIQHQLTPATAPQTNEQGAMTTNEHQKFFADNEELVFDSTNQTQPIAKNNDQAPLKTKPKSEVKVTTKPITKLDGAASDNLQMDMKPEDQNRIVIIRQSSAQPPIPPSNNDAATTAKDKTDSSPA